MRTKISSMLDDIADRLEAKGLTREAYEIDKVADELDSGPFHLGNQVYNSLRNAVGSENYRPLKPKQRSNEMGSLDNFLKSSTDLEKEKLKEEIEKLKKEIVEIQGSYQYKLDNLRDRTRGLLQEELTRFIETALDALLYAPPQFAKKIIQERLEDSLKLIKKAVEKINAEEAEARK